MSLTTISGTIQAQPLNDNFSYLNQQIGQLVFNVKDGLYGAKGDGMTNDSTAISAACTAAAAVNGTVFFPPGTYLFGSLSIPAGVKRFIGSGMGTILTPMGVFGLNSPFLYFFNTTGLEVGNFKVNVNSTTYPTVQSINVSVCDNAYVRDILIDQAGAIGVTTNLCTNSIFENIRINTFTNMGILHQASANVITDKCTVIGVGVNHGIQYANSTDCVISNCYVQNSNTFGFNFDNTFRSKIINCRSYNTHLEGININNSSNCLISGNHVYWQPAISADFGISVLGNPSTPATSQFNIVSNNHIENAFSSGIALALNSACNIVIGNKILNCNLSVNASGAGVVIYGVGAVSNLVTSNIVRDTGATIKYGVNEYDGGTGIPNSNRIEGNYIYNFVTAEVNILGALSKSDTWISYTPTIGSGVGALTSATATGKFMIVGQMCNVFMDIHITTTGTASASITATLPRTNINIDILTGRENTISGKLVQGATNTGTLIITNYDNTYPGANGAEIFISGSYQIA